MNFDINLIQEFNIGDFIIPFNFNIANLKENEKMLIVDNSCVLSNTYEQKTEELNNKLFLHLDWEKLNIEYDSSLDYILDRYKKDLDYTIEYNTLNIKSKYLLLDLIGELEDNINLGVELLNLKNFVDDNEVRLVNLFINKITEYLDLKNEKDMKGNNNTHRLQWALGETSTNPNPYFYENLNKATSDWSFREVLLRDFYKHKVYSMENARLEKQMEKLENNNKR